MHKINVLILEKDISEMKGLQKTLFNLLPSGINYCTLSKFYEEISGQIPIEILNKGWFLENLNLADKRNFERIKRLYDRSNSKGSKPEDWPVIRVKSLSIFLNSLYELL